MKKTFNIQTLLILLFTALAFSSCVDQDFDNVQTANVDPDLTATHTIKQLQTRATGQIGVLITEDIIIKGVIVGDDSSGNIYKKIILQQDSSGIAINVDMTNFYTNYRVGRRIFVKCKGLYISNNQGNFELGNSATDPVGRIPSALVAQYVVKGMWGQYITPKVYHLNDNIPTNTLVQFDNVEFTNPGVAWAATGAQNLNINDCALNQNTLIIYSSVYATFHLEPTPLGNGSLIGVYTLYGGAGELQIRDPRDAKMTNLRCNGGTGQLTVMNLDSIRLLDPGAANTLALPADRKIRVTVTSDYTTGMITSKNIYAQDATAGIEIRFTANNTFAKGTVIEVDISGQELSTFAGVLQINNVPLSNAIPITVSPATPRNVSITDINTNYNLWEGQLVKIDNVTISGTGIYSGANTLTDATSNTIELYSASTTTFANDPYPTGTVSVTGILTEYNGTKEILIRNTNDVQ